MTRGLMLITREFYQQDSLAVAPALVGCVMESSKGGVKVRGRIVETEAYPGYDAASHAFGGKKTPRTQVQFEKGGALYIYLIMGLHLITSVVVGEEGRADVVFIRSMEPLDGIEIMRARRGYWGEDLRGLTAGPGRLSVALGVEKSDNGAVVCLRESSIKIYKDPSCRPVVSCGRRINLGVSRADEKEAKLAIERQWRFFDKNSRFLSERL